MNVRDAVRRYYVTKWGAPARRAEFHVGALSAEVLKWDGAATGQGVTVYTTLGASEYPVDSKKPTHRVEFYLGLRPERDEVASPLADLALYAKRQNVAIDHGHTISAERPFWPNTNMHHFLVSRSSAPLLKPIELEDDIHVEFLQVTPIFESELLYKKKHQAEGLLALWEHRQVAFWDPNRDPEPQNG